MINKLHETIATFTVVSLLTERRFILMIITIRVTDLDGALIKRYASYNKETVSSLIKKLVMDKIEDDYQKLISELDLK